MKLKRTLCLILLCLLAVGMLASCGETETAPDGYYTASDPARDGCYFVVPSGWTSNRSSGILTAYVSSLNSANVTVAFLTSDQPSVEAYWQANEARFDQYFDPDSYVFGKLSQVKVGERNAFLYQYDGAYEGVGYRFLQYIVPMGSTPADGLCVITCTASTEKNAMGGTDFEDQYETFLEMVGYFRFAENAPVAGGDLANTEEDAPDGMKLASDPALLGISFYVQNDWTVRLSDGFISASLPDGISVGVTSVDYATAYEKMDYYGLSLYDETKGFLLLDYWNVVQAEYNAFFDTFTVTASPITGEEDNLSAEPETAGGTTYYRFSFTGVSGGVTYEMTLYVFRATSSGQNRFYTLLYTQKAGQESRLTDVEAMLAEVTYR